MVGMERHEIPAAQVKRLKELRERQETAGAEVIRAKAALYDALEREQKVLIEFAAVGKAVAEFLDIDPSKPYRLTNDCTAFEIGD
jgi:hypothetical protein